MKKKILIQLFVFLSVLVAEAQDCFRFTYLFQQKRDADEVSFHTSEMNLDFDGKLAFFYNEVSFKKDSLDVIAFDKTGNIADEAAYAQRSRLSGSVINDKSWIDFEKKSFTQYYCDMTTFYGIMPMEMPQWELTDKEEENSGYICKVAKGTFLGRDWVIWYTEEIPINIGPWLLWGTPGLIVYAMDSENIVNFRLLGVERIEQSRFYKDNSYRKERESKPKARVYTLSMEKMEIMHTRYRRDMEYFSKINGIGSQFKKGRDGSRSEIKARPYLSLIPDAYWQKK